MSITSISIESSNTYTDETRAKSKEKNILKDFEFILSSFKKNLNNNLFNLKEMIKNNVNAYKKQDFEKILMIINQIEILRSLLIESLSLTLVGVVIGLVLGYPFMLLVLENNIVSLVSYLYHIYFKTYIIAFLLTFGVAIAINMLLSLRIRGVKMVESLKSVE